MRAIPAIYHAGKIKLATPIPIPKDKPIAIMVVFPDHLDLEDGDDELIIEMSDSEDQS